jgi:hypothetical protein
VNGSPVPSEVDARDEVEMARAQEENKRSSARRFGVDTAPRRGRQDLVNPTTTENSPSVRSGILERERALPTASSVPSRCADSARVIRQEPAHLSALAGESHSDMIRGFEKASVAQLMA